jgi:hypothetical protein
MRIVNKQEFYAMPAGTLFSWYEPCVFEGLMIKGDTIYGDNVAPIDFWFQDLIGNVGPTATPEMFVALDDAQKNGVDLELEFGCEQRDALYDENAMYAVYTRRDVEKLSAVIKDCSGAPRDWTNASLEDVPHDWRPGSNEISFGIWHGKTYANRTPGSYVAILRQFPTLRLASLYLENQKEE